MYSAQLCYARVNSILSDFFSLRLVRICSLVIVLRYLLMKMQTHICLECIYDVALFIFLDKLDLISIKIESIISD